MVRIDISIDQLKDRITKEKPNWNGRWSQIKPIFLDFQSDKCGYCESRISGPPDFQSSKKNLYDSDVEHYRPKNKVVPWPVPSGWNSQPPGLESGPAKGYTWLETDETNYMASCKTCNSGRKKNYFPIRKRHPDYKNSPDYSALRVEEPYLLFPLADLDSEPRDLIIFVGPRAFPHYQWNKTCFEYWRARVTIELLGLNRADLVKPRQDLIANLALLLKHKKHSQNFKKWNSILKKRSDCEKEFSSCARDFIELHNRKPNVAFRLAQAALRALGRVEEADLLGRP